MEFELARVERCAPTAVADVGTGDGQMVRAFSRALPQARMVGIDYSERAIQLARARNPSLVFFYSDTTREKLGKKFDTITLIEVFEHIPLDLAGDFAASIRSLLVDGGGLFVTVPHRNLPVGRKHFQHFSAQSLLEYFRNDFEVEETAFLYKQGHWVPLLRWASENQYFILSKGSHCNLSHDHFVDDA